MLTTTPFIDVFNCMRRTDEQSFGGGVFIIVDTEKNDSWEILREKGISVSEDGKRALLYNPSHLLGLEAAVSIMSTVWLDINQQGTKTFGIMLTFMPGPVGTGQQVKYC